MEIGEICPFMQVAFKKMGLKKTLFFVWFFCLYRLHLNFDNKLVIPA